MGGAGAARQWLIVGAACEVESDTGGEMPALAHPHSRRPGLPLGAGSGGFRVSALSSARLKRRDYFVAFCDYFAFCFSVPYSCLSHSVVYSYGSQIKLVSRKSCALQEEIISLPDRVLMTLKSILWLFYIFFRNFTSELDH